MTPIGSVQPVDLEKIDKTNFARCFADSIVITQDGKLVLQRRPSQQDEGGLCLNAFGGSIEPNEAPLQAIIRELKEELGAEAVPADIVVLGAVAETLGGERSLIHAYFWYDRQGTITGCYEYEAVFFNNVADALGHSGLMDYTRWMLHECQNRKLL
ncbi:MAG: NUDIX domain-containing protein [Alphaproteobacteria bacterium]|nr:NUDIX domain-containing protein [Alphaproteobacteria bacterium]